jgi:hypothetical protein
VSSSEGGSSSRMVQEILLALISHFFESGLRAGTAGVLVGWGN